MLAAAVAVSTMFAGRILAERERSPIQPVPPAPERPAAELALGRALFHTTLLSEDGTVSCATCHDLRIGGHDPRPGPVSLGIHGRPGLVNAPTVYNADLAFRQFWDGRAENLAEQIDGPVQSEFEMGSLWPDALLRLAGDDAIMDLAEAAYPDEVMSEGLSRPVVKRAIAAFVASLRTVDAPFDRWLAGDDEALTALERRGWDRFKHYGCVSCHQGVAAGANFFQRFGVLNDYFKRRGNITEADNGRFNVTGNPADRHAFKVPSLRLVAYTAPYLHDGNAATLRDAVDAMFEFQLGREAPDEDKEAIVAFLRTLAGTHPELAPLEELGR